MSAPIDEDSAPSEITFETNPFSVNFHPLQDLVVVSDAEGAVKLYRYSVDKNERLLSLRPHKSGCREACFSTDGNYIFTASSDCSMKVIDVNTGSILYTREEAHDDPINCVYSKDHMLFTGDDEGSVKVWDMRQQNIVCEFQEHADFISEITVVGDKQIVATSGDGGVSQYNYGRRSLDDISEKSDNELLSVIQMQDGNSLVCGSQDGTIYIYDINNFESKKSFTGHPMSVDTLVKVNETTFLSGSSDGIIRLVGISPRALLGVVGEHSTFPVECIALSRDQRYLGSISHDMTLRFWNVSSIYNDVDDEETPNTIGGGNSMQDSDNEMDGDNDDDVDSDSDDSFDDSDDDDMFDSSEDEDIKKKPTIRKKPKPIMADDSDDDTNTTTTTTTNNGEAKLSRKDKQKQRKQEAKQEKDAWSKGNNNNNAKKNKKKKKSFFSGL